MDGFVLVFRLSTRQQLQCLFDGPLTWKSTCWMFDAVHLYDA
jgi:hypothetical protein